MKIIFMFVIAVGTCFISFVIFRDNYFAGFFTGCIATGINFFIEENL